MDKKCTYEYYLRKKGYTEHGVYLLLRYIRKLIAEMNGVPETIEELETYMEKNHFSKYMKRRYRRIYRRYIEFLEWKRGECE